MQEFVFLRVHGCLVLFLNLQKVQMRRHKVIIRAQNPDLSRSDAPKSLSLHSEDAYSICQYCFVLKLLADVARMVRQRRLQDAR